MYEESAPEPEVELDVPDKIVQSAAVAGIDKDEIDRMAAPLIAMWLFTRRAISQGQAAEWINMHTGRFMQLLQDFTVPLVNFRRDEVQQELEFVESISK